MSTKCEANNCSNYQYCKKYCMKHYARYRKYGDANYPVKEHKSRYEVPDTCEMKGCDKPHMAKNLCQKHYTRLRNNGDPNVVKQVVGENRASHPLYKLYHGMKNRCYNPNNTFYRYYGGRGIEVCDRWLGNDGFSNFIKDMGERPGEHTIDRTDNSKGYSPDNCRWVTRSANQFNRRVQSNSTTGVKGIHFYKANKKWTAYIDIPKGKRVHLGYFDTKKEAIDAKKLATTN